MKNIDKDKKAFTLIELLVVIAIIGLLSTLSIIALNSARAKARDAKRISDVKQMQVALEMFYNDTGDYPVAASMTIGAPIFSNASAPFLRAIPTPPTPVDGTACISAVGTSYSPTSYLYQRTGLSSTGTVPSYSISFCLGSDVGQGTSKVTGNQIRTITPAGIY